MNDLVIKRLDADDSKDLSRLLGDSEDHYGQYFTPFPFEKEGLEKQLQEVKKDCYWGLWFAGKLVGIFMLRGFDEGYQKPSFGVFISKRFSNLGLSKVALDYAISWCQLNHVSDIMLKVHPDNTHAKRSYEKAGFLLTGECPTTGHDIMEIHWN